MGEHGFSRRTRGALGNPCPPGQSSRRTMYQSRAYLGSLAAACVILSNLATSQKEAERPRSLKPEAWVVASGAWQPGNDVDFLEKGREEQEQRSQSLAHGTSHIPGTRLRWDQSSPRHDARNRHANTCVNGGCWLDHTALSALRALRGMVWSLLVGSSSQAQCQLGWGALHSLPALPACCWLLSTR
jgi:hypothetical protein